MRIFFACLFLFSVGAAHGQDFCNRINKEGGPTKTIYDYASPFDPNDPPSVRVTRSIDNDPDLPSDNFFIIFQTINQLETIYKKTDTGEIEMAETKLMIVFDDNTKFTDDTVKIGHDFTSDKTQAIRYLYYPLTDPTIKDFSGKKIAKFSLAGFEQVVPADSANAIMHYVQCMKNVK